jgi:hypothetical protein
MIPASKEGARRKRFIEGLVRSQTTLLPDCVDDYVEEENPARAVDAFVDMLDLAAFGFDAEPEATGRPGYSTSFFSRATRWGPRVARYARAQQSLIRKCCTPATLAGFASPCRGCCQESSCTQSYFGRG